MFQPFRAPILFDSTKVLRNQKSLEKARKERKDGEKEGHEEKMNLKSNTKLFRNSTCLKKDLITIIDIARAVLTSLWTFSVPLQTSKYQHLYLCAWGCCTWGEYRLGLESLTGITIRCCLNIIAPSTLKISNSATYFALFPKISG